MQYQMLVFVHNIKSMWYGAAVAYIIILNQHTPKKPAENKHQSTLLIFGPTSELPTAVSMPPM
jgi:hypothetical protein